MKKLSFEYKFTAIYLILGFLWIIFSDRILNTLISDQDYLTRIQTFKGWFYVSVTALLFFFYLRLHLIKLRNAEKKAVESDRLKTAFLHNISHEIRTPMNGIIGFAGLLDDSNITEKQKSEYLAIILRSSKRLLDLVNQVLDISMIETGNIVVYTQQVKLNELLHEVYETWVPEVKQDVSFSAEEGLEDHNDSILTDEYKLKQILNNLIDNAVKFTEKGYIRFGYRINGNILEFFVEDTGLGINKEYQEDIFKRFLKADPTISRFYEGIGLGLSICKGNLELLKGSIYVDSEPGSGSVFRFTIPYSPVKNAVNVIPEENTENLSLEGLLILVAEDEMMNFRYIQEILSDTGISIIHASNGQEAVDFCRNQNNIDLVLMDIKMPVMNGYASTRLIRKIRPELPVIAQSAYLASLDFMQNNNSVFNGYLTKPFLKEELIDAILKQIKIMKSGR
ncbi:MAG: ATP-binding protein [Bacteroidota bacterium]